MTTSVIIQDNHSRPVLVTETIRGLVGGSEVIRETLVKIGEGRTLSIYGRGELHLREIAEDEIAPPPDTPPFDP